MVSPLCGIICAIKGETLLDKGLRKGLPAYRLCLVTSTRTYRSPFRGAGGRGLPRVEVTSVPVRVFRYCPDLGAGVPGLSLPAKVSHLLSGVDWLAQRRHRHADRRWRHHPKSHVLRTFSV